MRKLSDAALRLKGQEMFQILARANELEREGKNIIHFELGDPDFDTPKYIVNAACNSLKKGDTHYTQSMGLRELRIAAAERTEKSRGFRPDLNQLLVTQGANIQIYYALACAVNPNEEVIVPDPGFVSYYSILDYLGIKGVRVPLKEENEFRMNPKDVENAITDNTRMIIVNSPSNPTGSVMTKDELEEIYKIAKDREIYLLSDEIYARMIYTDSNSEFFSPSMIDKCKERTIVVNGFSKSYAMTGWRLGVVTAPAELTEKMGLLLETIASCVPPFVQRAGIEALTGSQQDVYEMKNEYMRRRDVMVNGLNTLPGVKCLMPKGAFYAFPNIKGTGKTSREFSKFMLEKAGVALAPGDLFGENGEGHVRLCYCNSVENIENGIGRMRDALKEEDIGHNYL